MALFSESITDFIVVADLGDDDEVDRLLGLVERLQRRGRALLGRVDDDAEVLLGAPDDGAPVGVDEAQVQLESRRPLEIHALEAQLVGGARGAGGQRSDGEGTEGECVLAHWA